MSMQATAPRLMKLAGITTRARLMWLKTALLVAFCLDLFLSAHLWIGPRSYPAAPVIDGIPPLDGILARVLFGALFLFGAFALVWPNPRKFITGFIAIVVVFCLFDQTRWQPWVFQYTFMLTALALFSWGPDDEEGASRALGIARLVIACTYALAGLQKLNLNFIQNDFVWIMEPVTRWLPLPSGILFVLGALAPLLQIAFGIGLLTVRFRRTSLVLAVAMHCFILAMFGPAGHNWNNIIWPWTTAMAAFDIILFAGRTDLSLRGTLWTGGHHLQKATLVLFVALPLLSFLDLWDSYLSAALYSGNLNEAQIYLSDAGRRALPPNIARYAVHASANTNVINIQRWAIEDMNVTPYPETRVFRRVAKGVCADLTDKSQLVLIVREQRMFFSKPETGYRCSQL